MHGILHISEAANLALHAGMALAGSGGTPLPARAMAQSLDVSYHHLAKVLHRLEQEGLVRSTRGPGGGYVLARPPGRIRLMDLYEAMDGRFPTHRCLFGKPACPGGNCIMGDLLSSLNHQVRERLAMTRLSHFEPLSRRNAS